MTLEDFIGKLKKNSNVDALAVTGSAGIGKMNPVSDYDLLIVVDRKPVALMSGATEIDGRFTDLGFVTVKEIRRISETFDGKVPVNSTDVTMIRSLKDARIALDVSGALTALQQRCQGLTFLPAEKSELISLLDKTSYNLAHTKRKNSSVDPDYLMAVDLRMLYQLADLMVDYFIVRGEPWPGEKEAICYWKTHDIDYYNLFRKCLYETDRGKRVQYYEQLASETIRPVGNLWHTGKTRFRMHPETEMTEKNLKAANQFWRSLLGNQIR